MTLPVYSIVTRPVGFGASTALNDDLASVQALIDAVKAGTATKNEADNAETSVVSIQQAYGNVTPTASGSTKTFSWQNIMLGFAGGIFAASVAFAAFGDMHAPRSPSRRSAAPRRVKPRSERTTIRPRLARA